MRIEVTRSAAAAVRRGHPWVYREGLVRPPRALASGAPVDLHDDASAFLGRGLWDAASPIAVRVHERDPARPLDEPSMMARIERALGVRDRLFGRDPDTTAYRLCNGEGDRVPGLVIDRYGDVAVIRTDGEAMRPWIDRLTAPLARSLARRGVRSLITREPAVSPEAPSRIQALHGPTPPDRVLVQEHGVRMEVDLAHGQKTGAFLDQRENRARVRALAAAKKRVLNLFSYAGGFSIAAALGGAAHVTSVDTAAAAHASASRTFRENAVDPTTHEFISADVFTYLDQARARGEHFDLIVSDPPSFAHNERSRPRALGAYRRLHRAIAAILADGAVLCAASCSSHVSADDFLGTLDDISLSRGDLRLLELHGQPPDHPSLPAWPEGRYLKFAILG
jgi:23S rRNA (cytosine1962-C5)-methyltransferase